MVGPNSIWLVSYKKRKFGYRHIQRKDHGKTQGETAVCKPGAKVSEETNLADTSI